MSVVIGRDQDRTLDGARRCLKGEPSTLSPGAAIALLSDLAADVGEPLRRNEAIDLLVSTLTEHQDGQVRAAAARALGGSRSDIALESLRAAVDSADDGELLAAASLALARIGDRGDIDRLDEAVRRSHWEPGRQRTSAAMRLLAHRARLPVAELSARAPLAGEHNRLLPPPEQGVELRELEPGEVAGEVRLPPQDGAFVPAGARPVAAFSCGDRRHVVMLPPDDDLGHQLAEAPSIAATLLGVNESTGESFVRWLVLTEPAAGGSLSVTVARPTGEVGFVGDGQVDGNDVTIRVLSVARPGASALELEATVRSGVVSIRGVGDPAVTVRRRMPIPEPGGAG